MCSGCLEQDGPVLQAQRYQLRQQHLHAGVAYAQLLGGLCWESAACCTRSRSKPFVALNEPSLAENAGKKVLNMLAWTGVDRKTDVRMATPFGDSKMDGSTAAGDDSVAASEKSSDVGLDRLEETPVVGPAALRKTLSCSAKGILGCKLVESASGPVLPPGSPMSPTSPRCSGMATSASQFLPRESTGPLLWRRTACPTPIAPCAQVGLVARRPRETAPPSHVLPACPPSCHPFPVQAAAWGQQYPVMQVMRPLPTHAMPPHAVAPQVPHAVPNMVPYTPHPAHPVVQLRPRHSMLVQPMQPMQPMQPAPWVIQTQAGCLCFLVAT